MKKRQGVAERAHAAQIQRSVAVPTTFDGLVKQGLEYHDQAEKQRRYNPTLAIQLYKQALETYERAEKMINDEDKSSCDLYFNLGVAYSGLASVFREMDSRNSAEQAGEMLLLACQSYRQVMNMDAQNAEALNNWVSIDNFLLRVFLLHMHIPCRGGWLAAG
jgi:hypothetical protein